MQIASAYLLIYFGMCRMHEVVIVGGREYFPNSSSERKSKLWPGGGRAKLRGFVATHAGHYSATVFSRSVK